MAIQKPEITGKHPKNAKKQQSAEFKTIVNTKMQPR